MKKQTLTQDKILTFDQAKRLFKEVKREKDAAVATGKNLKFITDYFLFKLAFNLGTRISEISNLKWSDIGDDHALIRQGKGNKSRSITFGHETKKLFLELKHIQQETLKKKCENDNFIFLGERGRLTRFGINHRLKYWVKERNVLPANISFHSFRHGYATKMLDCGIPLSSVRDQLGHSNISITSCYLHFTGEAKRKIKAIT